MGITRLTAALLVLLGSLAAVQAQPEAVDAPRSEVSISVEQRGVGNTFRPGSWAGLQVRLDYAGDEPRPAVVVWRLPDADGDIVLWRRTITLNPGATRATTVWLYADLSLRTDVNSLSYVEVYEALEPAAGTTLPRLGESRAILRVTPGAVAQQRPDMIAIADTAAVGLDDYSSATSLYDDFLPTGHALTALVTGVRPETIPDRWMGLDQFSTFIWGPRPDLSPGRLSDDQAAAIREWVLRGGHFIVILPRVADIWTARTGENPLDQLLPSASDVRVTPVEEAPASLIGHLVTDDKERARLTGTLHLFTFSGPGLDLARPGEAVRPAETVPLMSDRLGRHVAIQRAYGTGVVTVIGVDLEADALRALDLPNTDVFWNRVLGRRYHAPTLREREQMAQAEPPVNWRRGRDPLFLDEDVAGLIAQSGSAAAGLLLAVLVFAAYWLVAGPGAWAALRYRKRQRHAWLAFLAAAGLFTAVSWVGATILKPRGIPTRHFTVVTAVSGQDLQSASTFFGSLLPEYGSSEIQIADDDSPWHSALSSFEHPRQPGQPFPDPREYQIEADDPYRALVPTRATAKQMKGRWLGQLESPWGLPYAPSNIRVTDPTDPNRTSVLEGTLRHSFPRAPDRLTLIYVSGEAPFQSDRDRVQPLTERARLLVEGLTWTRSARWAAGDALDLSELQLAQSDPVEEYLDSRNARDDGVALALYHHALPPNYAVQSGIGGRDDPVLRKRLLYSADVSHWLTRPCLIVVATFDEAPCPVPLTIDDEPARSVGEVQFRWVYPLPHTPRTGASAAP